ncbi:enoyl-CoA hydratase/isomerase family protein [Hydrogenophaga sp. BPS33]|uniref:enoyl-CoA hydratase/isomerase family protein n=1 Tax=Hydrogenophaga sp. BPS33 TaxID=2651974 RepID=UPI001356ECEF|nr:enoyl-CoA hydratase/isomerase family protein [Hydrogenophaga sp. BPS33]
MSLTSFVPHIPLEEYSERLKEHFVMRRENGILEVRFHTLGKEALWGFELHRALPQMFQYVGQDPENECMILTGTGDHWIKTGDGASFKAVEDDPETRVNSIYDLWYVDGTRLVENVLWGRNFPIISVINGPGFHTEFGLLCDLTIAADDTLFWERHYCGGMAPGDGQFLVYQQLLGTKRAAHAMYTRYQGIPANEALEWGLINEVHPREKLLPRAWELAHLILQQDRIVRRMTVEIVRRPWKRLMTDDFAMHFAHECFAAAVHKSDHAENYERYKKDWGAGVEKSVDR